MPPKDLKWLLKWLHLLVGEGKYGTRRRRRSRKKRPPLVGRRRIEWKMEWNELQINDSQGGKAARDKPVALL